MNQFISELGATGTSHAAVMIYAGFISSGLMIVLFGISLLLLLPKSVLGRIGAVLISLFGIGATVLGYFPCDEGCPPKGGSVDNLVHNSVAGPVFLSAIIGIFLLALTFRKSILWKQFWVYSLLSALVAIIFFIVTANYAESPILKGFWQRLLMATIFLWLSLTTVKLFKLNRKIEQSIRNEDSSG